MWYSKITELVYLLNQYGFRHINSDYVVHLNYYIKSMSKLRGILVMFKGEPLIKYDFDRPIYEYELPKITINKSSTSIKIPSESRKSNIFIQQSSGIIINSENMSEEEKFFFEINNHGVLEQTLKLAFDDATWYSLSAVLQENYQVSGNFSVTICVDYIDEIGKLCEILKNDPISS